MSKRNTDTTLVVRSKRSGIVPAFIVLIVGGVTLDYDAGHWHLLHHLFGGFSVVIAFAVIVAFVAGTVKLCSRPAGYTKITEGNENDG